MAGRFQLLKENHNKQGVLLFELQKCIRNITVPPITGDSEVY